MCVSGNFKFTGFSIMEKKISLNSNNNVLNMDRCYTRQKTEADTNIINDFYSINVRRKKLVSHQ